MSLIVIHHTNPIIPSTWVEFLKDLYPCQSERGPWIAGGAVRRLLMGDDFLGGDLDYFCASETQWNQVVQFFDNHIQCGAKTDCSSFTSFQYDRDDRGEGAAPVTIQIIKTRFEPTLEAHLSKFDFTICQTGWDGEHCYATERALIDLVRRSLSLVGTPEDLRGTWLRILKYAQQGFTPTPDVSTQCLDMVRQSQKGLGDETYPPHT